MIAPRRLRDLKLYDLGLIYILFNSAHIVMREPAEVYSSYFVAGALALYSLAKGHSPRSSHVAVIGLVGFLGIVGALAWSSLLGYFKVYTVLACVTLSSGLVIDLYRRDIARIFSVYLSGCLAVSVLGLIQIAGSRTGVGFLYDFHWMGLNKWGLSHEGPLGLRLNSIFSEPSGFAIIVSGGAFWSIAALLSGKRDLTKQQRACAYVILAAYLLTFSAILVPALSLIAFFIQSRVAGRSGRGLQALLLVSTLLYFAMTSGIYDRIEGIRTLASGHDARTAVDVHGSSEVMFDHFLATIESLKKNPVFGSGLGMHEQIYAEYRRHAGFLSLNSDEFNAKDANSMLLRTTSELGLFGLVILFYLLRQGRLSSNAPVDAKNISSAFLCIIFLQLLRQGNYVYNFFPFFFLGYIQVASSVRKAQFQAVVSARTQKSLLVQHTE